MSKTGAQSSNDIALRVRTIEELLKQQKEFLSQTTELWEDLVQARQDEGQGDEAPSSATEIAAPAEGNRKAGRSKKAAALARKVEKRNGIAVPAAGADTQDRNPGKFAQRLQVLESELAERLQSLEEVRAQLSQEKTEARQLRAENEELRRNSAKTDIRLEAAREHIRKLEDDLVRVENILRQRQEEIEQTLATLGNHRDRAAQLEGELKNAQDREKSLQRKLKASDGWVAKLAEQRAFNEKDIAKLKRERDAQEKALQANGSLIQRLREEIVQLMDGQRLAVARTSDVRASPQPAQAPDRNDAVPPHSVISMAKPTELKPAANLAELIPPIMSRDKGELLELLVGRRGVSDAAAGTTAAPAAVLQPSQSSPSGGSGASSEDAIIEPKPAVAAPPPPTPAPMATASRQPVPLVASPRNQENERRLKEAREEIEWLRNLAMAALEPPKHWWWRFMPRSWLKDRQTRRFKRRGLFDAKAYWDCNPDVAADGMDPLFHYLKHGMREGRERP